MTLSEMTLIIWIILSAIHMACQTQIDNRVEGDPTIVCMPDGVYVEISSKRPFTGRLFVKGLSTVNGCVKDYTKEYTSVPSKNCSIRLSYGTCNIQRQRALEPRGMSMLTTIIIQYHPVFITEVDRAYSIKCFYQEELRTVTSSLEVSMIPTTVVADNFQMPICTYSVRHGNFDGPAVSYVTVGDTVYHRWDCRQQDPNLETPFGMLVHSCYVDDGVGNKVLLVDSKGCSLDPYIFGHLEYSQNLMSAAKEAHVFKFADRNLLYFQCQIRLCIKTQLVTCEGMTPPRCAPLINKRSAERVVAPNHNQNRFDSELDSDVIKMYVLDEEEKFDLGTKGPERRVCLSYAFLMIGTCLFILFTGMLIMSSILISRSNRLISMEKYFSTAKAKS